MSTLGAVLEGMDRGVMNGLNLYKTVQDEARQKREEQYRAKRDAIADQRYEQTWENNLERQRVADDQWDKTHKENVRKTDADIEYNKGMLGVSQQNARTSAGRLSLDQQRQQYVMDEERRARQLQTYQSRVIAASYGPDGNLLTGEALAENLNRTGAIADLARIKALETGTDISNYSGLRAVPGPGGRSVIQVSGKDRTGKPIEGQAFMSERGTSDPDDPYIALDLETEVARINPALRDAQRSNALARDQKIAIEQSAGAEERATLADIGKTIDNITSKIHADEKRLAELQAARAKLPETITRADPRGDGMNTFVNPEGQRLDHEIATLSKAISDRVESAGLWMQRAQQVPKTLAARTEAKTRAIDSAHRIYGETYNTAQRTLAAAQPAAQQKVVEAADKSFESFRKEVAGDVTKRANAKGEGGTKGTANQVKLMLDSLPDEYRYLIGSEPGYRAAARHVLDKVGQTGITGDLAMMIEATAAGADMDVYARQLAAPQHADMPLAQREQFALEVAKRAAANPSKDEDTIAGELYMELMR